MTTNSAPSASKIFSQKFILLAALIALCIRISISPVNFSDMPAAPGSDQIRTESTLFHHHILGFQLTFQKTVKKPEKKTTHGHRGSIYTLASVISPRAFVGLLGQYLALHPKEATHWESRPKPP